MSTCEKCIVNCKGFCQYYDKPTEEAINNCEYVLHQNHFIPPTEDLDKLYFNSNSYLEDL